MGAIPKYARLADICCSFEWSVQILSGIDHRNLDSGDVDYLYTNGTRTSKELNEILVLTRVAFCA